MCPFAYYLNGFELYLRRTQDEQSFEVFVRNKAKVPPKKNRQAPVLWWWWGFPTSSPHKHVTNTSIYSL